MSTGSAKQSTIKFFNKIKGNDAADKNSRHNGEEATTDEPSFSGTITGNQKKRLRTEEEDLDTPQSDSNMSLNSKSESV